jgi:hypothetical protein
MTLEDFYLKEFLEELDLRGGNLETWPDEKRVEAEKLLAASPEARTNLSAVQETEALLAITRETVQPSIDYVAARAMCHRQDRPITIATHRLSWAVAGTAALVFGLLVGVVPLAGEQPADLLGAALEQTSTSDVW